jgi:type II secretory pathway predicted ATPase ExeA
MNEGKQFFNTRAAQIAQQSLDRIAREEIIGMVVARSGYGKSAAITQWRNHRGDRYRHIWVECTPNTQMRPVLTALVNALGIGKSSGAAANLHVTEERIAQRLAEDPVTIIFDQADFFTVRTFELLRCIWDRVSLLRGFDGERAFPLALFGEIKLRHMLERDDLERLRRRTFHKAELPPLSLKELELILQTKWADFRCEGEVLRELHQLAGGSFGWVNNIMRVAVELAAKPAAAGKDGHGITSAILRATQKHLMFGLPEEE